MWNPNTENPEILHWKAYGSEVIHFFLSWLCELGLLEYQGGIEGNICIAKKESKTGTRRPFYLDIDQSVSVTFKKKNHSFKF